MADFFACVVGADEGDASLFEGEACGAGEGSVGVGFVFFAFDGSAGGVDDDDFGFGEFAEFGEGCGSFVGVEWGEGGDEGVVEVGVVVVFGVAELFEAFHEVGLGHFVVEVEGVDWWLGWLAEDGFAGCEGCGDVEGDPGFACFGSCEECGLSASGDEGFGDPVFCGVFSLPEVVPVDEHVVEFVWGGLGWGLVGLGGLCLEVGVGGLFPVSVVVSGCVVAESVVAAFWEPGDCAGEDDEGVVAVVSDGG